MVTFPNCKINLGLNILQKREDGYHDINTIFLPIPWYDVLEIISSPEKKISIKTTGLNSGIPADNLCLKAYHLIKKNYPHLPEISIYLHKTIPAGAGLGGGSADAAFMLTLLNNKFDLKIPSAKMYEYAGLLGSDCSFFLFNKPAIASGKGEILKQIDLSLAEKKIFILNPGIHIPTAQIFKEIQPAFPTKSLEEIIHQPIETWKNELKNDFEEIVLPKFPIVEEMKNTLYDFGAEYASMTGTGSTLYAIFEEGFSEKFPENPDWISKWVKI
ncbi:MAG: 4-(cytidine 5'-diphospho)-2-C-methyl-D-erythritol kinase [Ginsengibacter sp.]